MKKYGRTLSERGELLLERTALADSFWTRFMGLMGKETLMPSEGLLLMHTGSIHTCFMRFPIQAVYLDRDYRVLRTETVPPWRAGSFVKGTRHVLELASEEKLRLRQGERLQFVFESPAAGAERSEEDA